jgi:hypothetical protein
MANTFGQMLRLLRRQIGLTQVELGRRLGVAAGQISNWETGKYEPQVEYRGDRPGARHAPLLRTRARLGLEGRHVDD